MNEEMLENTIADGASVFVQTNEATNRVLAFPRDETGMLGEPTAYATAGLGTGEPHLPSQGSVVLSRDRRFLLVSNAASNDVTVFRVDGIEIERIATAPSGGEAPRSIAERDRLVYVLNTGKPAIAAFRLSDDGLDPIVGAERSLSAADADPAQIGFTPDGSTLVVTERGNDAIETFSVRPDGTLGEPTTTASSGLTPYGFAFTSAGTLVVAEAFRAEKGAAAASSYSIRDGQPTAMTRSVGNGMSEICWAVVTPDDRFVFTTNFADSTVSRFAVDPDGSIGLADAVAGDIGERRPGLRDEDLSDDGRFLVAIDADGGAVVAWRVAADGSLARVGSRTGLPTTIAGLAAR
jgi:6-phosphogluconolactonase